MIIKADIPHGFAFSLDLSREMEKRLSHKNRQDSESRK